VIDLAEMWQDKSRQQVPATAPSSAPSIPSGDVVWGEAGDEFTAETASTLDLGDVSVDMSASTGPVKITAETQFVTARDVVRRRTRVISRLELIHLMTSMPRFLGITPQSRNRNRYCVGLVGFPNVGKSSVINTILGVSKSSHGVQRVGVSSTPGKTKHFQTLDVDDDLMLCDCPGLVFPSFMNSTADMVCSGILPINQMRDYQGPAAIIASRVPQHLLEAAYGIRIRRDLDVKDNPSRPPTASEFLSAFCAMRGYITSGTGRWDEFRACKEVLHDFNDGKILFVVPPPTVVLAEGEGTGGRAAVDMKGWLNDIELTMARNERVANRIAVHKLSEHVEEAPAATASTGAGAGDMVFGGGNFEGVGSDGEYEMVGEEDEEEEGAGEVVMGSGGKPKREHKKLKHWGKKNRKLREKNPYDESDGIKASYTLHTMNRAVGVRTNGVTEAGKTIRARRQNPHYDNRHEAGVVRAQPIPAAAIASVTTATSNNSSGSGGS
jgi:hypothetical protein